MYYVSIEALEPPADVGTDENSRVVFTFPLEATVDNLTDSIEVDIAQMIVSAGLGVLKSSLFVGSLVKLPTGAGPFIVVRKYEGGIIESGINEAELITSRILVSVRGSDFTNTDAKATAVWRLLKGVYNVEL